MLKHCISPLTLPPLAMFLQMMINLEEQVVILDEAHNIEDASREAASFKFNDADLEAAVIDLNTALDSEGLELPENFRHGRDLVTTHSVLAFS